MCFRGPTYNATADSLLLYARAVGAAGAIRAELERDEREAVVVVLPRAPACPFCRSLLPLAAWRLCRCRS